MTGKGGHIGFSNPSASILFFLSVKTGRLDERISIGHVVDRFFVNILVVLIDGEYSRSQ